MTEWNYDEAPDAPIVAPVKLYDATRGYGFLSPGGGQQDIFCHASVLRRVGLEVLLEGATVTCEAVLGDRGPQVARILAVDFSTAAPAPARGERRMGGEAAPVRTAPPADAHTVRAIVKWYVPSKGYGFLEPEDGSADLFCHAAVVEASGRSGLPQGAVVTCDVVQGDRGPQVARILSVDLADAQDGGMAPGRPQHAFYDPPEHDREPAEAAVAIRGTVKFYDPVRGFGFIVPDDGGREVFVHTRVLARSGLGDLQPGQRVNVWAEEAARGPQATEVEPIS